MNLLIILFFTFCFSGEPAAPPQKAEALEFREFFQTGTQELKPSEKLQRLNGKRVRLAGYMAKLEETPLGAFYLCAMPVYGDESGGGTADLPVNAVRVVVLQFKGKPIAHTPQPLAVVGQLELGPHQEEDGTISAIRLTLEPGHLAASLPAFGRASAAPKPQRRPSKKK